MEGYNKQQYLKILHDVWGYPNFRGIQEDIIQSIANGKDTLGLMPTGGGKSLTFQVPALAKDGVCIVITPLIALMRDQVENLRNKGIIADTVYSGMSRQEILKKYDNCILGNTKLLYISPERISSDVFKQKLAHMNVSFITIDEAHCISQWGYDFRPSYLQIADIRKIKPNVAILALTATATEKVIDDIQVQLQFARNNVFRMSFERKNLAYIVRKTEGKITELIHILYSIQGSAIVYTRSRKDTKYICEQLEANHISATYYHAGLERSTKDERQKAWHNNEKRVMVATNAFGMGIDKPDVRAVIHTDCPDSIEAYFQEAGRAGRDGKKAYAVLLYNNHDEHKLKNHIKIEFPEKEKIKQIYEHLAYFFQLAAGTGSGHTFKFNLDKFCRTFNHFPAIVNSALKILTRAGYIEYEMDPDSQARLRFTIERDQLYLLKEAAPNEEIVIQALLRIYAGLFVDYNYIDEGYIAEMTGLTKHQVYLILKSLSQRHILHFIPQQSVPLVKYIRNRVLPEEIVIPESIYEKRKMQMIKHIKAIVNYANNDVVCRSRQLLYYFGEENTKDCKQCDVCLSHNSGKQKTEAIKKAIDKILELLAYKKRLHVTELNKLPIPRDIMKSALSYLTKEELIEVDYCYILDKDFYKTS